MACDEIRDRITDLPDETLYLIISLLPMVQMVRTSVLSARWRRLWTTCPVLHFTRTGSNPISPKIVDYCLRLCTASEKLRSVRFAHCPRFAHLVDQWIRFAADRNIDELTLTPFGFPPQAEIPASLFDCRSLKTLKMEQCSIPTAPSGFHGFQSLTTLVFFRVSITDDQFHALLSACPCIETLSLSRCFVLSRLEIHASTMRSLTVCECKDLNLVKIIWAPELRRRLMYSDDLLKIHSIEGVERLEEAALLSWPRYPFKDRLLWREFISAISNAKILSVNCWFFEFMLGEDPESGNQSLVFENLKEFHWWPIFKKDNESSWGGEILTRASIHDLICNLKVCPSLEQLCIHCTLGSDAQKCRNLIAKPRFTLRSDAQNFQNLIAKPGTLGSNAQNCYNPIAKPRFTLHSDAQNYPNLIAQPGLIVSQPYDDKFFKELWVPFNDENHSQQCIRDDPLLEFEGVEYVLPKLKKIRMIEFSDKEDEIQLVKLLLDKAVVLESMVLFYVPNVDITETREETYRFNKASPLASISFLELRPREEVCPKHGTMWFQFMKI